MSVPNVQATHRQCPRCHKVQPVRVRNCEGCGRRFQVPPPVSLRPEPSGLYAGVPAAERQSDGSGTGKNVSAWWGPAFAALFVTPLGWVLLPLALLLCLVAAALSVTLLPMILGVIAAARLRSVPLPAAARAPAMALTLIVALTLNGLLWHVVREAAFTLSPPP